MGKPAARQGDMTVHGGTVTVGQPTVLIGGQPAARIGDMHACPMVNPGTPPPPHVGGPVAMGSPTVLIGGMPAARVGDMLVCSGPPDTIAMGCPTVLIGEVGSGATGGGGSGGGAAAAAKASAATARFDNNESTTKEEHWVEFEFVDQAGLPVSGVPYTFTDPDGNKSEGTLRMDGTVRRDALSEGQSKVVLQSLHDARWSRESALVGETVQLIVNQEGLEESREVIFHIYRQDLQGPEINVDAIPADVQGKQLEVEWTIPEPDDELFDEEPKEGDKSPSSYSAPEYRFEAIAGPCKARSGALRCWDYLEISLRDEEDRPIRNATYIVYLPDGTVRRGQLDSDGEAKEEKLPPGEYALQFPDVADDEVNT